MPAKATTLVNKARTNLDFYHSPAQLRFDTWHRLEEYPGRLNKKHMCQADVAVLQAKADNAIGLLQTVENYSAFPSQDDFKLLWQLFEQEDYELLARIVARIVCALSGGIYRSRQINLRAPSEFDSKDEAS